MDCTAWVGFFDVCFLQCVVRWCLSSRCSEHWNKGTLIYVHHWSCLLSSFRGLKGTLSCCDWPEQFDLRFILSFLVSEAHSTGVVFIDSMFSLLCKVLSLCPPLVCHLSILITLTPYSLIFHASHFNVSFFLTTYSWSVVILGNTCLSLVILIYQLFSSW